MRLLGGLWRGRMIAAPADRDIRPTAQRTRESLFNRLMHAFAPQSFTLAGAHVVDVCAGSGALGLEALSRGAVHVTFIEQAPVALDLLHRNIVALGAEDRTRILRADVRSLPRSSHPCDLALIDPPYGTGLVAPILTGLATQNWLRCGALVTVETGADEEVAVPPGYALIDRRVTGRAAVTVLQTD
ncbi:MAG: 16S rRNA (guanine(966)-N(2))-methyltransferase RsmD [Rhodospirillaceae bacterium]|nr:MAG: 16S rRNA (guanine(966)-N(2))-methyltransferase RsmD [Rhodospirillaceae bacterium]